MCYGMKSEREKCRKKGNGQKIPDDNWAGGNGKGMRGKGEGDKMTSSDFLPPPSRNSQTELSYYILGSEHLRNDTVILVR